MKKKLEIIEQLDSLLDGDYNFTKEQRNALTELREQTTKSNTYGDLKSIGIGILKIVVAYFKDP